LQTKADRLQKEGAQLAEAEHFFKAIHLFHESLQLWPEQAHVWDMKAQVFDDWPNHNRPNILKTGTCVH
jgi:hypothetical protein